VKPFVSEVGINYRIVVGDDTTAQLYGGVDALPTTFVIDREGKIAAVHVGLTSKGEIEHGIEEVLGATSVHRDNGSPAVSAQLTGTK
jgi:cytochrome c biogenesis protein CcmG/thiol:disulfide interchange protein DsbE